MNTNELYFDHISIEKVAHELSDIHNQCTKHANSNDSYASPAFTEWKKGALTLNDIPMQTYSSEDGFPMRKELFKAPWEDSIKNFIFDTVSLNTSSKFSTCILLSEVGYKYQEATIHMIAGKYGKDNVTLVDVIPHTYTSGNTYQEFKLRVRHKDINYESIINSNTLTSNLTQWYEANDTVIFCHDSFVIEYQNSISMMPESTWSISCTLTNYIINKSGKECTYVCPNFACSGSLETRAVSSGTAIFTDLPAPANYKGKLNYYSRCIRTSKHSSGKCYDCKILQKTIESIYKSPMPTPVSSRFARFSPTFSKFIEYNGSNISDSGYGSTPPE